MSTCCTGSLWWEVSSAIEKGQVVPGDFAYVSPSYPVLEVSQERKDFFL